MTQIEWRHIFKERLINIMKKQQFNQMLLARNSGLSVSRISDYINLKATPSIFAIINIAYALNVDVSDLIDFDKRIEK